MTLATGDLTTLATAKAYLDSAPSDMVLSGMISRLSRSIYAKLNRSSLLPRTYTQQFGGMGTRALILPEWPVLKINSLIVSGVPIPISNQESDSSSLTVQYGYRFQPWSGVPPGDPAVLELIGSRFLDGSQNVVINYLAGYSVLNEPYTIAGPGYAVAPQAPYGLWALDQGVTYQDTGLALASINSAPTSGQYKPPDVTGTVAPIYNFAVADTGRTVLISYGFVPADLEEVVLELLSDRVSWRRRSGVRSQSLASQETIVFDSSAAWPSWAMDALGPYISVLPPAIGITV